MKYNVYFVGSLHSFNFILVDQIADVGSYQTNQAMALKMLKATDFRNWYYLGGMYAMHALSYANSDT